MKVNHARLVRMQRHLEQVTHRQMQERVRAMSTEDLIAALEEMGAEVDTQTQTVRIRTSAEGNRLA